MNFTYISSVFNYHSTRSHLNRNISSDTNIRGSPIIIRLKPLAIVIVTKTLLKILHLNLIGNAFLKNFG